MILMSLIRRIKRRRRRRINEEGRSRFVYGDENDKWFYGIV